MALITERYAEDIQGVLTCYDRMIIQGYVAPWSHSEGMTSYLYENHIKIFDYQKFEVYPVLWTILIFRPLMAESFRILAKSPCDSPTPVIARSSPHTS